MGADRLHLQLHGGPIVVTLDGEEIARFDAADTFAGTFTLPHYRTVRLDDPDECTHKLVAAQDDVEREVAVVGERMGHVQVAENVKDALGHPLAVGDSFCSGSPPALPVSGEALVIADAAFVNPRELDERAPDWNGQWVGVLLGGQRVEIRGGVIANTIVVGNRTFSRPQSFSLAGVLQDDPAAIAIEAAQLRLLNSSPGTQIRLLAPLEPLGVRYLDVDDLTAACATVGVDSVGTLADYAACFVRRHVCAAEGMLGVGAPRAETMFSVIDQNARSAFCAP